MSPDPLAPLQAALLGHIQALEAFGSRHSSQPGNQGAQAYLEACLASYGYPVLRSACTYNGRSYDSPWVQTNEAGAAGAPYYLLAAHFDSIHTAKRKVLPEAPAPGADDNATGVAVLLKAAKALRAADLSHGLGFVFFNVEEDGQYGSKQFAKDWKASGRRLDGVINIDTIGTWPKALGQGGKLNYVTDKRSRPFMDRLIKGLGLPMKEAGTPWQDDHASFWAEGYAAIELTEEGCTPVMHSDKDTSEKLDMGSVTLVADALIKVLATPNF